MRKGPNDDAIHLISLISLLYCFMPSVGRLKSLRSGPICMTELQQDEENDETSVFPFFSPDHGAFSCTVTSLFQETKIS